MLCDTFIEGAAVKVRFRAVAFVAAIFVVSGLGSAAPAGATVPRFPGLVYCRVQANNPHDSHGTPGMLVGKSRFWCTDKVESVTNIVKLQKRRDGKWVDVPGTSRIREVPGPKAEHKYTNQTDDYKCEKGTFRTASEGRGVYHGQPEESHAWEYSKEVKDPCK